MSERAPTRRRSRGRHGPTTLAFDIGGTGLKAAVLDAAGTMVSERVRVATPYPLSPRVLLATLRGLAAELPDCDRASAGFPGMVRHGRILSAPEFIGAGGLDTDADPTLVEAWTGYDLRGALRRALRTPVRVANDADVQGAAVISGRGVELVITLGTGVGTALFADGRLAPHLELAHHPFRKGETYNEQLGEAARRRAGVKRWNRRVAKAVAQLDALTLYDHLYIGGGNSTHVTVDLGPRVSLVDNSAGIRGGARLWDLAGFA